MPQVPYLFYLPPHPLRKLLPRCNNSSQLAQDSSYVDTSQLHNTMAAAKFWTIFAGVIGVIALGIYLFGIPPELKRKLERQALKTMGENKMSYVVKGSSPSNFSVQQTALTPRQTRSLRSPRPTKKTSSS